MSHSSCRPRSPGQNPLSDMPHRPDARPGHHVAYACGRARSTFHQSYTGIFCTRQDRRCPVNWVFSRGPNGARCPASSQIRPQRVPGPVPRRPGSAGHSNRYMTRAAFSGRPEVRKKAASPGPNSSSGGSEAQSSSAFVPSTAALPEPLCTESGARVASSLARALRASLPPGGCRPGVGGFAVADAPHGQGSPRRRRRSAGSLNVTAERVTAAPDPFVLCVLSPLPALPLSGREGEMARSMRRNGTAYWRALLMALWSLLNPTHPQ